jgi:hypothetical protein
MTSNSIYIVSKYGEPIELKIAECDYGDDADLLFQSYKKAGYACRVVFHGTMGDEEILKCEAQP